MYHLPLIARETAAASSTVTVCEWSGCAVCMAILSRLNLNLKECLDWWVGVISSVTVRRVMIQSFGLQEVFTADEHICNIYISKESTSNALVHWSADIQIARSQLLLWYSTPGKCTTLTMLVVCKKVWNWCKSFKMPIATWQRGSWLGHNDQHTGLIVPDPLKFDSFC